jgi:hypothetical protein
MNCCLFEMCCQCDICTGHGGCVARRRAATFPFWVQLTKLRLPLGVAVTVRELRCAHNRPSAASAAIRTAGNPSCQPPHMMAFHPHRNPPS